MDQRKLEKLLQESYQRAAEEKKLEALLQESYLRGRQDERARAKTLLEIDLLLLDASSPKEFVARAVQLIEHAEGKV